MTFNLSPPSPNLVGDNLAAAPREVPPPQWVVPIVTPQPHFTAGTVAVLPRLGTALT